MGAMKSAAKVYTSQGSNGSKGGVRRSASKAEVDWGNSKGKDGVCFHCGRSGHVAAKCIADMPQEVKDLIISGPAHVAREDESDESDDNMAETVAFARENPHTFVLMANTLQLLVTTKMRWTFLRLLQNLLM